MSSQPTWSGVRRGPLQPGEWIRLTDTKGRRHNIQLVEGKQFFTNRGSIDHDDLIGRPEGFSITSSAGGEYLVFRPLLNEFVVSMPRQAAVVYPKDADQAVANVDQYFDGRHPAWRLTVGDLVETLDDEDVDRVILDMLAPWECVDRVADVLTPGGLVCAYVATTTQLGKTVETLRAHGGFTEPAPWETLVRDWHVEGLAVRPGHKMNGHTGFLVTARRMAVGQKAPVKKRRPAPGAYGEDYDGPRPAGVVR